VVSNVVTNDSSDMIFAKYSFPMIYLYLQQKLASLIHEVKVYGGVFSFVLQSVVHFG